MRERCIRFILTPHSDCTLACRDFKSDNIIIIISIIVIMMLLLFHVHVNTAVLCLTFGTCLIGYLIHGGDQRCASRHRIGSWNGSAEKLRFLLELGSRTSCDTCTLATFVHSHDPFLFLTLKILATMHFQLHRCRKCSKIIQIFSFTVRAYTHFFIPY